MRVKQKFKVRIEDPPRRRHMVFLGGAVLANIVSRETPNNICNHQIAILTIISTDGRQGKHVDIQGRVARTRCPCPGQVRRSMKKRRREVQAPHHQQLTKFHQITKSIQKPHCTFYSMQSPLRVTKSGRLVIISGCKWLGRISKKVRWFESDMGRGITAFDLLFCMQ